MAELNLTQREIETVLAYADAGMNASIAGAELYVAHATMYYRLNKIYTKTGLNPRNFYDLVELVEIIRGCPIKTGGNEQ